MSPPITSPSPILIIRNANGELKSWNELDWEQSLFSSKTVGKTQNKRGRVTVLVTTPTLLAARRIASPLARHAHSHARTLTCFGFFLAPRTFEEKKDCSQSRNGPYDSQEIFGFYIHDIILSIVDCSLDSFRKPWLLFVLIDNSLTATQSGTIYLL